MTNLQSLPDALNAWDVLRAEDNPETHEVEAAGDDLAEAVRNLLKLLECVR